MEGKIQQLCTSKILLTMIDIALMVWLIWLFVVIGVSYGLSSVAYRPGPSVALLGRSLFFYLFLLEVHLHSLVDSMIS
jgi:hypothetical protein